MYGAPQANRQSLIDLGKTRPIVFKDSRVHAARVRRELRHAALSLWELIKGECKYLPAIVHYDEYIGGAVMGMHEVGKVLLVATDKRIIFLDKKPLYVTEDEMSYDTVSGIELGHVGMGSTVTLRAGNKDYKIRTLNCLAAEKFVRFVEHRGLERQALQ